VTHELKSPDAHHDRNPDAPTAGDRSLIDLRTHARHDRTLDARIDEIAARQHGLITREQLLEAGLTARMIFRRTAQLRLVQIHRGIYRIGPVMSPHAREMAAVLACGTGAVLSGWSAAGLWQLPPPPEALAHLAEPGVVFVTAAGPRSGRRPGIRLRRVPALHASEVTRHMGIPVTTAARTLLDIAADLARHQRVRELERSVGQAQREKLTTTAELNSLLARHPTRPGAALLRQVVGGEVAATRSQAEERLLDLIRSARLPTPRVNHAVAGYIVDFHWPAQRLVVEVDGFRYHTQRDRFESDRTRNLDLAAVGVTVIRVTWRQLTKEASVIIGQIALALGRAGG
jgi:very-short-patch-repair endonuclease/predicted transcriptional regulator of viral defense system